MHTLQAVTPNDIFERIIVKPAELLLDNKNPRFYGEKIDHDFIKSYKIDDPRLQEFLRQSIYNKYKVHELVTSITEVGFLRLDPVVVIPENGLYKVIEGNRRVAAIKTIIGNIKRKVLIVPETIEKSINEIEVIKLIRDYDDSTIWMIQGIRHVSGIRDWGPFQKAELIKALYDKKKLTFKQIGSIIGLSPQRVSTILKGYYGVIQMMADKQWNAYATPCLFSHFEQAYVRSSVREWLGWDKNKNIFTNKDNLHKFYYWISQIDNKIYRVSLSSMDIRDKLPNVLEHKEAKALFISNQITIDEAYSIALTGKRFSQELSYSIGKLFDTLNKMQASHEIPSDEKSKLQELIILIERILKK